MITDEEYKKFLKILEWEPCIKKGKGIFIFSKGEDAKKIELVMEKYEEEPKEE